MTPSTACKLAGDLLVRRQAAVDDQRQRGEVLLQARDDLIAQRRQLAVFLRAHALQPGIAGVDDEDLAAARRRHRADEVANERIALVAIDADPVLDRHRNR